jgi:hypothetical protein
MYSAQMAIKVEKHLHIHAKKCRKFVNANNGQHVLHSVSAMSLFSIM